MHKSKYRHACSTAATRKALAETLLAIGSNLGLQVTVEILTRAACVHMTLGDYHLTIDLDADLPVDCFMGHWYTRGTAFYPRTFGATIQGTINTCHYNRATTLVSTFDQLLAAVNDGFIALKNEPSARW